MTDVAAHGGLSNDLSGYDIIVLAIPLLFAVATLAARQWGVAWVTAGGVGGLASGALVVYALFVDPPVALEAGC